MTPSVEISSTEVRHGLVHIEGLDAWALECSELRFFKGQQQVAIVPLREYPDGNVSFPSREADWLAFYGSPDGQCPWKHYTPQGFDPNHIEIAAPELSLRFLKIMREPKATSPPYSP